MLPNSIVYIITVLYVVVRCVIFPAKLTGLGGRAPTGEGGLQVPLIAVVYCRTPTVWCCFYMYIAARVI